MKKFRKFTMWCCAVFVLSLFLSGCETVKGMGKDFEKLKLWDKDFQEKYW